MSGAIEELLGSVVLDGQKKQVPVATLDASGKVIGLYFSAHWCPPCRGFTPKLAEFYAKMKDRLEVVFISSDKDEAQWGTYFAEMPWLALPFSDRTRKTGLSEMYGVRGIPTLVLVDAATGETINVNARSMVDQDPSGAGFPWVTAS
jgi:nucleoredoxin